jgi:hypothetical protein
MLDGGDEVLLGVSGVTPCAPVDEAGQDSGLVNSRALLHSFGLGCLHDPGAT